MAELDDIDRVIRPILAAIALAAAAAAALSAQDRLKLAPSYDRAQRYARDAGTSVREGALAVSWQTDSRAFEFTREGKRYRFDVRSRKRSEVAMPAEAPAATADAASQPERGRQFERAMSPDGTLVAFHRDRNVWLSAADGTHERAVTEDGSAATRVKYGTASWVYGEELSQRTAMWWSPDGQKLAYYRFDERSVPDYYVVTGQLQMPPLLDTKRIPTRARRIRSSICSSMTSRRRRHCASTCAAASRSTTTRSATTSTASRGPPTAASSRF